jgi:hypothetical protein
LCDIPVVGIMASAFARPVSRYSDPPI